MDKIFLGCDHGGFNLKQHLLSKFPDLPWEDLGTDSDESVDYPDFASKVAKKVLETPNSIGVLICGTGQGMSMRANKYKGIRAALCWNEEVAQFARDHNNANVLCLGARVMDNSHCEKILTTFLETEFSGGRHERRVNKIEEPT